MSKMQNLFFKHRKTKEMRKCFSGLLFLMIISTLTRANDNKPVRHSIMTSSFVAPLLQLDTSRKVKNPDVVNNKPTGDIIKVVPNARKQAVPLSVKLSVKPVKIIKPKIIKPVIKLLN